MPGSEEFVQSAVHALEAGGFVVWVKRGALALGVIGLIILHFYQFRGLSTSVGMDRAQIGRAIAKGEGWSTKMARPLAIGQLQAHGKDVAKNIWSDTYNAPLPPLVNAVALLPVKASWKMNARTIIYAGDKAIVTMSMLLFIGSIVVWYFTARRLCYADRRTLWLPEKVQIMSNMSDYKTLGGSVNGLYLTPISGTENRLRDIAKGEHRDWATVIQRNLIREKFPLKWNTIALGFENECIFLSDHDREHQPTALAQ
jgi:hypothetical protein